MKKLLTILGLILLVSCSPTPLPEVSDNQTTYRNDTLYLINSQEPFTGIVVSDNRDCSKFVVTRYCVPYLYRTEYKDGKKVSESRFIYNKNGQLKSRGNFKNDVEHGLQERYDEWGSIMERENYKNGKLHGLQLYFHYLSFGQVETKKNYKDGKPHGLWEYFDKDGNLTKTEEYKDGKLIE